MGNEKQKLIHDIRIRREQKKRQKVRRRIVSAITVFAMTLGSMGFAYTASANEITITDINEFTGQNDTITIKTHENSVEKILEKEGVVLSNIDKLNVSVDTPIEEDTNIVVKRGKEVTVKTKDGEQIVPVTTTDAKAALAEAGISVGDMDEVKSDGNTIELVAVEEKEDVKTEVIPFETEYVEDDTLTNGVTSVKTEGVNGVKSLTYKVLLKDGNEISRELMSEDIIDEPVNKVVLKGTKSTTVAAASSTPSAVDTGSTIAGHKYSRKITMTATAYSTHPSENGGYTVSAMGNQLGHGIVAIDPSVVPLGSKVYVEATDGSWVYGVASAEDTGGAIKGNRIDLCYEGAVSEVNQFGRRSCNVYILAD